jgi:uncharacterized membrane protein
LKTNDLILIAMNAALYAAFGYMTSLGIFAPIFGVVRFWPSVIVPAVFGVLFGPKVGAIGAALGIFVSDMAIHGNALLSLSVGVPSNFIAFYILSYLARKRLNKREITFFLASISSTILLVVYLYFASLMDFVVFTLFLTIDIVSVLIVVFLGYIKPRWLSYGIASLLGLLIGSTIIGFGVWIFSQFFILPSGEMALPLYAAFVWLTWTFSTEIPFLIMLGPPILEACFLAFPSMKPESYRREKQ